MGRAHAGALVIAIVSGMPVRAARADDGLQVVPLEGGSWASQIATLQATPRAPGPAFRVRVLEEGSRRVVPCGHYALSLDAVGAAALRLGRCDPSTAATEVTLHDRAALFAPGDPVPVPLPVSVRAVAVRFGGAGGGAAPVAGVEVRCIASVRPFIADLLNGTFVLLTPDRYRLEPLDPRLRAEVQSDAWTVTAQGRDMLAEAAFRVLDLRDGREVVRSRVAMQCRAGNVAAAPVAPAAPVLELGTTAAPFRLPARAVGRGSTQGGTHARLSCATAPAPTVVWRFVAPSEGTFEFLLQGSYDTALEVRAAAEGARSLGCNDDDEGRTFHSRVVARLARGEAYHLLVSGAGGEWGRYELAAIGLPDDIELPHDSPLVVRIAP
jgi:hypothetical protein